MADSSRMRVLAIVPMLIGVAALIYAGHSANESYQYLAELKPATATVREVFGRSSSTGTTSMRSVPIGLLGVRYTDASGRERTGQIGANEGFKRGDRVEILYSPSYPHFVMLARDADAYLSYAYLPAAIGLVFVLGAIAMYMKHRE